MQATGYGFCGCGCGERTALARRNHKVYGWVKGEPLRFVNRHHLYVVNRNRPGGTYKTERFRADDRGHSTPCHTWLLAKTGDYGWEWDPDAGKGRRAHITAYERAHGPVPAGLELDHLCRNRDCVNPEHLEAVTHQENIRRAYASTAAAAEERGYAAGYRDGLRDARSQERAPKGEDLAPPPEYRGP